MLGAAWDHLVPRTPGVGWAPRGRTVDLGHFPPCPQAGVELEQGSNSPRSLLHPAASLVPERKGDFASIVLRALLTGICVSMLNACLAGGSQKELGRDRQRAGDPYKHRCGDGDS